jgi:hypothetical protein
LLEFFFQIHDPTTKNRQGNDIGLSYRSAILYTSDEQRRVAEDTTADVDRWRVPGDRARPQDLDEGAFIMIGPREVFTSQDEVFMSASSAAPISPRVRRLRIKCTDCFERGQRTRLLSSRPLGRDRDSGPWAYLFELISALMPIRRPGSRREE